MTRARIAALLAGLACALVASAAEPPKKNKAITREWTCDNGRTVLVNYHPLRIREPAWLTYLGNRVEVQRKRVDRGIAATSADGKINWHEQGNSAELEYQGLLDQPLHCETKAAPTAKQR